MTAPTINQEWNDALDPVFNTDSYASLRSFLSERYEKTKVYPEKHNIYRALKATPLSSVKVVILGQDPYHGPNQANGFSFAVSGGMPPPPSLRNLLRELRNDRGISVSKNHTTLEGWAKQGVLLLNSVLTVEEGTPGSHTKRGWEEVTDFIIKTISDKNDHVVFILLGGYSHAKAKLIDPYKHGIIKAAHPSPLSAYKFFGCKMFTETNNLLKRFKKSEINWGLVDLVEPGKEVTDLIKSLL